MTEAPEAQSQDPSPEGLVAEFQSRRDRLDQRLVSLEQLIADLRQELQGDSQVSLQRLAQAAKDMANGQVYQKVDIEAKGELGALVASINQTLLNLQQLDASVKHQSTQVPELASQLDAITTQIRLGSGNPGAAAPLPKDEQGARIRERSHFVDMLETRYQLTQARLSLLRSTGHIEDWAKSTAAPRP